MPTISRRTFLAQSALAGISAAHLPRLAFAEPPSAADALKMSIARWKGGKELPAALYRTLTRRAIEALGGMKRFVSKTDVVWVKPNIGWNRSPEQAANTHPDVVAELVKLCFEAGAKTVKVGDHTCNQPEACYTRSGIGPAVEKLGGEMVYLDRSRFRKMDIKGERLKQHPVYPEIVECDLVINVPVTKHHGSTRVSLCMKNYMGVVEDRRRFHQDLPTTISDITRFMQPELCVLDATRMLTAHGPTGGRLEDVEVVNTVAAGTDIVALDAFGSELLGNKPTDIRTVVAGDKNKLGTLDYRSLKPKQIDLS